MTTYDAFRARNPELFGNLENAATEILFDRATQHRVGAGVVYEDPHLLLVKDAVRFRDGRVGGYLRLVHAAGSAGAAVLAVCGGKIVLIRHFRHATRRWHWEIPRGFAEPGEPPSVTATRETLEELGIAPNEVRHLGDVHTDTGLTPAAVALYLTELPGLGVLEAAEGIDAVRLVTCTEYDDLVRAGELTDSFTLAAVQMARLHGFLEN